ncbi:Protein of unknown function [Saccharopolyspora flava]|uniref:DUF3039 domain-containing protein n=2 Tax=Saccharopolyspora TaxID=1835 RepID=A0A1I6RR29_9PSEU|nr:Protein of unknown function [Saccharopolyspora flava]
MCGIIGAMSTMTLPETDTRNETADQESDDRPEVFHYVQKDKIAESAVMGTFVVALCGEVFPVTKSAKPGSPVCPDCKEIFESLPPGGGDE